MPAPPPRSSPSRQGLVEYVLLVAFLALAATGAIVLFGDDVRAVFGLPAAASAPAPARLAGPPP
jgi:Flp pilus assembly pilin Flp